VYVAIIAISFIVFLLDRAVLAARLHPLA